MKINPFLKKSVCVLLILVMMTSMPLSSNAETLAERLDYTDDSANDKLPAFFKGYFKANKKQDCFVHLNNFTKGFVVVNGFNIGRFWNIGPQLSLYLPAPLLKEENEIIVFEEESVDEPIISIRDYHDLEGNMKSVIASVAGVETYPSNKSVHRHPYGYKP